MADLRTAWPNPVLFWFLHVGATVLAFAFVLFPVARSFLANGQPSVLMLGCGLLMSNIGVTAWTTGFSQNLDKGFAVYNTSLLLSALCHFAGVVVTFRRRTRLGNTAAWLTAVYAGGAAAMGLVIWATQAGRMPTFFIEGQGSTVVRGLVVCAAVALFVLTAVLLLQSNRRAPSPFLHWYALGLLLLAGGLAGSTLIAVKDSPLQWVTRVTQVTGLVYMCVAALASRRRGESAEVRLEAVEEAWRENALLARLRQQTFLGWVLRYALALLAVLTAFGLRLMLTAWVGPGLPTYVTFYPAMMLAALLGGFGPGLVATALAGLAAMVWILPPVGEFTVTSPIDRLGLAVFFGMGLFMSVVAELYRRSRDKAAAYDRETALRENEERFRLAAQCSNDFIYERDIQTGEARFFGDIDGCLGYAAGAFPRTLAGWMEYVHPEDLPRVMETILEKFRQGEAYNIEYRLRASDGSYAEWSDSGVILRDAAGTPVKNIGAARDITGRKRAERQLEDTRFLLSEGQRIAHMGSWQFLADTQETIWSDEECRIYGLPAGSSSPPYEVMIKNFIHPDYRELLDKTFREALRAGSVFELEHKIVRADGSVRVLADLANPYFDANGKLVKYVGTTLDITERKRAEEQIHELTRRLTYHVDNSPLAVIEWGPDMRLVRWSGAAERVFGWSAEDVLGKRMEDLRWIYEEDKAQVAEVSGELRSGSNPRRFSYNRNYRKDGSVAHCEWYNSSLIDESGALRSILSLVLDVTERERAEQEVQKLASVVRHSREFVSVATLEGVLVFINEAGSEMLGLSAEAVERTHILQVVPAHLRDKVENEVLPELLKGKGFWEGEMQYQNLITGRLVDVHATTFTVKNPDTGMPIFLANTSIDITERKRAENALRESEEKFRSMANAMPQLAWIANADGYIFWYNQRWYEYTGTTPEQMEGWGWQSVHDPDMLPKVVDRWKTSLATGEPFDMEFPLCGADGNLRPFLTRVLPLKDPQGRVAQWFGTNTDISERKRAEDALRESERALQRSHDELEQRVRERTRELATANEALHESAARLAEAQRMAHLGSWTWDFATDAAHWSDEAFRLLGFEPQSVVPSYDLFIQRVYPDDRLQVDAGLKGAASRNERHRDAFRVILPNDEVRHLSIQGEAVVDEWGKAAGLAGTLMDITDQVLAREEAKVRHQQLVQADKMVSLGILTSGVAHEINNPNHAIMSNTNLLADAWTSIRPILERTYEDMGDFVVGGFDYSKGREEYPKMLQDIMSASRRIEGIVTELRDFARYSPEETLSPIEVQPVIESACLLLSSMVKKSTDHFTVSHTGDLPKVLANRQRLEQVLINLIQNACQALPSREKGLTVSVSHAAEDEAVVIVVTDEGVGISEENINHLGDPFFTTKRHFGGTGLGLWVSFNIVREHGGKLEFFSKAGEGTRAVLTLRAARPL